MTKVHNVVSVLNLDPSKSTAFTIRNSDIGNRHTEVEVDGNGNVRPPIESVSQDRIGQCGAVVFRSVTIVDRQFIGREIAGGRPSAGVKTVITRGLVPACRVVEKSPGSASPVAERRAVRVPELARAELVQRNTSHFSSASCSAGGRPSTSALASLAR